jgi:hypothetical protein
VVKGEMMVAATQVRPLLKLDLGCGQNKQAGFTGVDIWKGADVTHDLFTFPWPFENNSVSEIFSAHFFEHVPGLLRGKFMDEVWRILTPCGCNGPCPEQQGYSLPCPSPGGSAMFLTPYYSSMRAVQDFTHTWPPICETTYCYFNRKWREANKLDHYDVHCDFNFTYGYILDQETAARNVETQLFMAKRYVNAVSDLQVMLQRRG